MLPGLSALPVYLGQTDDIPKRPCRGFGPRRGSTCLPRTGRRALNFLRAASPQLFPEQRQINQDQQTKVASASGPPEERSEKDRTRITITYSHPLTAGHFFLHLLLNSQHFRACPWSSWVGSSIL